MLDSEKLEAAMGLLSDPEKWIKGDYHRFSESGQSGSCALGACIRVGLGWSAEGSQSLASAVPAEFLEQHSDKPSGPVPRYNDHDETTHSDIMALFRKGIRIQKGKEAVAIEETVETARELVAA